MFLYQLSEHEKKQGELKAVIQQKKYDVIASLKHGRMILINGTRRLQLFKRKRLKRMGSDVHCT